MKKNKTLISIILGISSLVLGITLWNDPAWINNLFGIEYQIGVNNKYIAIEFIIVGIVLILLPVIYKFVYKFKKVHISSIKKEENIKNKFRKTRIINLIIWTLLFFDSIYLMYSTHNIKEFSIEPRGLIVSKLLIIPALILLIIYILSERLLFREKRIQKFVKSSPKRLTIPLYIVTILGLAFAQSCIIWAETSLTITGKHTYLYIFYSISLVFIIYSFPWKWRLNKGV